jgi:D-3-phosphoglycerate dehydrogenase
LRVLVTEALAESGINLLRKTSRSDVKLGLQPDELLETIGDYDGLIIRSATQVTAEVIEAAGKTQGCGPRRYRGGQHRRRGRDERGILVANAPESNTIAAGRDTLGLMLAAARRIPGRRTTPCATGSGSAARSGRGGRGEDPGARRLRATSGPSWRAALSGMRMRVLAYDPYVSEDRMRSLNVERAESVDEVLERSDFVSLHVPRTPQTTGMIDAEALEKMKPSAYLINVARGGIVDETALYNALKEKTIAGAALDVFREEPITDSPLFSLPNAVVTPHLGASTVEARTARASPPPSRSPPPCAARSR